MSDKDKKYLRELAEALVQINDAKLAEDFLSNILTPPEKEEIARRLQIVKMLMKGVPQREVAEKLGVSVGTVSRGARELKYGAKGFEKILSND